MTLKHKPSQNLIHIVQLFIYFPQLAVRKSGAYFRIVLNKQDKWCNIWEAIWGPHSSMTLFHSWACVHILALLCSLHEYPKVVGCSIVREKPCDICKFLSSYKLTDWCICVHKIRVDFSHTHTDICYYSITRRLMGNRMYPHLHYKKNDLLFCICIWLSHVNFVSTQLWQHLFMAFCNSYRLQQ